MELYKILSEKDKMKNGNKEQNGKIENIKQDSRKSKNINNYIKCK
jgi:hypothetical protein